jgi:hypothetical protein
MPISFSKEDILGSPLDAERHALLSVLDRLDLADRYGENKYVRPLVLKRLREVEETRKALGLPESDPAQYAEGETEI